LAALEIFSSNVKLNLDCSEKVDVIFFGGI
jgi:hypothetical protein